MTSFGRAVLAALMAAISLTIGAVCVEAKPSPAPAAMKAPELSAETRGKLNEAVREMSRLAVGSDQWYAAVDKVLGFGPEGQRKVLPIAQAKYRRLGREYKIAFARRGKAIFAARLGELKKTGKSTRQIDQDIRDARKDVLDLVAESNLEKSEIVAKGDPAMKTLEALMGLERKVVLDSDEALAELRGKLLRMWVLRSRCDDEEAPPAETQLLGLEEMLAMQAMPISSSARSVLEANFVPAQKLAPEEAAGIDDLNRMRLLLGLSALAIDLQLCEAARGHSRDMVEKKFFAHESPVPGKATPWDRARKAGTTASGENIAAGTSTGAGANRMWFHSPGHFKNMFGARHRRTGLGNHDKHWTQMFGR